MQPRSLSRLSLTWIGRSLVRFTRDCVVFSCVALRVSLKSYVARCFGRFAGTHGRRRYRSRFSLYKSCSVRRRRRFSFSSIALSCSSISCLFLLRLSSSLVYPRYLVVFFSFSSRVPCSFRFSFVVFRFCASVSSEGASVLVRVFVFVRLLTSCGVTFVVLIVDRRIFSVFRVCSSLFV